MRSSVSESNIIPACALVFLFYLVFLLSLNALLPEHAAAAAGLFAASLLAEYRLLSAMLSHVYDKHFSLFRNMLALSACACCVFFMLRGNGALFPLCYTLFAALPLASASVRRKREGAAHPPRRTPSIGKCCGKGSAHNAPAKR